MREYVLTKKERDAVEKFLKDHAPNDYIHLLRHRAKQSLAVLKADVELLEKLIEA